MILIHNIYVRIKFVSIPSLRLKVEKWKKFQDMSVDLVIVIRKKNSLVTRAVLRFMLLFAILARSHSSQGDAFSAKCRFDRALTVVPWCVPAVSWYISTYLHAMVGSNCSIYGCSTSRRKCHSGTTIFSVTKGKDAFSTAWREKLISIITKHREIDSNLREQIRKVNLHICEKHFKSSDIEQRKYEWKTY